MDTYCTNEGNEEDRKSWRQGIETAVRERGREESNIGTTVKTGE